VVAIRAQFRHTPPICVKTPLFLRYFAKNATFYGDSDSKTPFVIIKIVAISA